MSKRVKWCQFSLVFAPVYLAICTSEAEYLKICKQLKVPKQSIGDWINAGADGTMTTMTINNGKPVCIVCVRPRSKQTRAAYAALIVHEAVHVWQKCRREIGESDPSAEFEAYAIQSITQTLLKAVGL